MLKYIIPLLISIVSCEDVVNLDLEEEESVLVVDALIDTRFKEQRITLSRTQAYFSDAEPPAEIGATVTVVDVITEKIYPFLDLDNDGRYTWIPKDSADTFAMRPLVPGEEKTSRDKQSFYQTQYVLNIALENGEEYIGTSSIERNARLDSIFIEKTTAFFGTDSLYIAEVFARDQPGLGDCYYIKAYKNGVHLNAPFQINIAYDAGNTPASRSDSIYFYYAHKSKYKPNR